MPRILDATATTVLCTFNSTQASTKRVSPHRISIVIKARLYLPKAPFGRRCSPPFSISICFRYVSSPRSNRLFLSFRFVISAALPSCQNRSLICQPLFGTEDLHLIPTLSSSWFANKLETEAQKSPHFSENTNSPRRVRSNITTPIESNRHPPARLTIPTRHSIIAATDVRWSPYLPSYS